MHNSTRLIARERREITADRSRTTRVLLLFPQDGVSDNPAVEGPGVEGGGKAPLVRQLRPLSLPPAKKPLPPLLSSSGEEARNGARHVPEELGLPCYARARITATEGGWKGVRGALPGSYKRNSQRPPCRTKGR